MLIYDYVYLCVSVHVHVYVCVCVCVCVCVRVCVQGWINERAYRAQAQGPMSSGGPWARASA